MKAHDAHNPLCVATLSYAQHGWAVFPLHTPILDENGKTIGCSCQQSDCTNIGKHPRTMHGVKDATTDEATIRKWWKRWPEANIGVACGEPSGIDVVDVDGQEGQATIERLQEEHGRIPETLAQITGSGGNHRIFKFANANFKNAVKPKHLPGLDVRTTGGYIVVDPSLHQSGNEYKWQDSDIPPAEMPQWLIDALPKHGEPTASSATAEDGKISEGERNETLFRMGCALRRHGATFESILSALQADNQARCQPPLGDSEVQNIAKNAAKYEPESSKNAYIGSQQASQDGTEYAESKTHNEFRTAEDLWAEIEAIINTHTKVATEAESQAETDWNAVIPLVESYLWNCVEDASHWNGPELRQFCGDLPRRVTGLTKTFASSWQQEVKSTQKEREKRAKEEAARQQAEAKQAKADFRWAAFEDTGLPIIFTAERHMREISAEAVEALHVLNAENPTVYQRGGALFRLKGYQTSKKQYIGAGEVTPKVLKGILSRCANFIGIGKEGVPTPVRPPLDIADDILLLPEWEFPLLKGIVQSPIYTGDGILHTTPGYQQKTGYYYNPVSDLEIPDPIETTPIAVEKAKSLIFEKWLGEFEFADQSSRANALALFLLPFVRDMIDGCTPLHLVDAPKAGSGKGLLADVLLSPAIPDGATIMTQGESDAEWRKRITSALSEATPIVLIDNLATDSETPLNSPSFAGALTAKVWKDRLLGTNINCHLPVDCVWVATGNNVEMSDEIQRRTIWIRLLPTAEHPEEREFRIPDLRKWTRHHRSELVLAALTLIQKWVSDGMPLGNARLGSYEQWAEVMSGIMDSIGVDGFLANRAKHRERTDTQSTLWREFVTAWHRQYGTDVVTVSELFDLAASYEGEDERGKECVIGEGILNDLLTSKSLKGRRTQFGTFLKSQVDKVYNSLRIVADTRQHNTARYHLEIIDDDPVGRDDPSPMTDDHLGDGYQERGKPGKPSSDENQRFTRRFTTQKASNDAVSSEKGKPSEPSDEPEKNPVSNFEKIYRENERDISSQKIDDRFLEDGEKGSPGLPQSPEDTEDAPSSRVNLKNQRFTTGSPGLPRSSQTNVKSPPANITSDNGDSTDNTLHFGDSVIDDTLSRCHDPDTLFAMLKEAQANGASVAMLHGTCSYWEAGHRETARKNISAFLSVGRNGGQNGHRK